MLLINNCVYFFTSEVEIEIYILFCIKKYTLLKRTVHAPIFNFLHVILP